jgi:hypothetical protein
MDQYQYRLLEPNEDYKQAKIEKGGITATFTLAEVEAMQERNRTALKEVEGNLEIRRAEIENIKHFHPDIAELPGEKLTAAWIYREALAYVAEAEPKRASITEAIAENDGMVADVMQTLGFEKAVDPIISDNANSHDEPPQQSEEGQS